ncbi:hypothetical protein CRG98_027551 [Punica granatum]|uniref:Uncharacterized protein n=1 Tax=Punica granatum TaxID=22663 RepID=A0A2I0J7B7_PUNGR|nr:hypothetical protein CRG98_027551 [Punica granatum]
MVRGPPPEKGLYFSGGGGGGRGNLFLALLFSNSGRRVERLMVGRRYTCPAEGPPRAPVDCTERVSSSFPDRKKANPPTPRAPQASDSSRMSVGSATCAGGRCGVHRPVCFSYES